MYLLIKSRFICPVSQANVQSIKVLYLKGASALSNSVFLQPLPSHTTAALVSCQ